MSEQKFFIGDVVRVVNDDNWFTTYKGYIGIVKEVAKRGDNSYIISLNFASWWGEDEIEMVMENRAARYFEPIRETINKDLPFEFKKK